MYDGLFIGFQHQFINIIHFFAINGKEILTSSIACLS